MLPSIGTPVPGGSLAPILPPASDSPVPTEPKQAVVGKPVENAAVPDTDKEKAKAVTGLGKPGGIVKHEPDSHAQPAKSILKMKDLGEGSPREVGPTRETTAETHSGSTDPMESGTKNASLSGSIAAESSHSDSQSHNNLVVLPTDQFKPLAREISLPPEPTEKEPRALLAVKLPNGQRVQRYFPPDDKLLSILHFAEVSAKMDFTGCELIQDVPKMKFSDLSITIRQSGLANRTVLHIHAPD